MHEAPRAELSPLRRLLFEIRAGLHLALFDHADGSDRSARSRVRSHRALGRCDSDFNPDSLGQREQPVLQDGRADELHPKSGDHRNKHLLKNKVAAFIIMGGQDNVQGVAGQLMTFFAEVGCQFPQFPFIAHSRGWSAEDMERNVSEVQNSRELREGAQELIARATDMAKLMIGGQLPEHPLARGGRKAHQLDSEPRLVNIL